MGWISCGLGGLSAVFSEVGSSDGCLLSSMQFLWVGLVLTLGLNQAIFLIVLSWACDLKHKLWTISSKSDVSVYCYRDYQHAGSRSVVLIHIQNRWDCNIWEGWFKWLTVMCGSRGHLWNRDWRTSPRMSQYHTSQPRSPRADEQTHTSFCTQEKIWIKKIKVIKVGRTDRAEGEDERSDMTPLTGR